MLGSHFLPEMAAPIANNSVQYFSVYVIVGIFSWLSLRIIMLIFRDYSYSKDVISINNRCV